MLCDVPILKHSGTTLLPIEITLIAVLAESSTVCNFYQFVFSRQPKLIFVIHKSFLVHEAVLALICEGLTKDGNRERVLDDFVHSLEDVVLTSCIRSSTIAIIAVINVIAA